MRYLVVGSGIRGISDCLAILRNEPSSSVCLVDAATTFGGGVRGLAVEDFAVDPGVHLFDSIPRDFAALLDDIAAEGMREIEVRSASTFNGEKTDGFSLPDLSTVGADVKARIREEILAGTLSTEDVDDSLDGLFLERFGPTARRIYSDIYRHIYSIASDQVSKEAIHSTSLHRIKFDTDDVMLDLKNQAGRLDQALAARRARRDLSGDTTVTVYPADGRGMAGLNDDIQKWLTARGVDIHLATSIKAIKKVSLNESEVLLSNGHKINVDRIIWSAGNYDFISELCGLHNVAMTEHMHYAPMVLAVLVSDETNLSEYTYMQNFDVDRVTFRSASAGTYSNQFHKGRTFITCECPAPVGSAHWVDHDLLKERLYRDLIETGFIHSPRNVATYFFNAPKTFFAPKVKFAEYFDRLAVNAWDQFGIYVKDPRVFFRREMIVDSQRLAEVGFEKVG